VSNKDIAIIWLPSNTNCILCIFMCLHCASKQFTYICLAVQTTRGSLPCHVTQRFS